MLNPITLLSISVCAILSILLIGRFKTRQRELIEDANEVWPYYAKAPLNATERVLYDRLKKAFPGYMILAKVQLSAILGVRRGKSRRAWHHRVSRMSVDFAVCNSDAGLVTVIELNELDRKSPEKLMADAKKARALASAGLHIFRWDIKAIPTIDDIQREIKLPETNP